MSEHINALRPFGLLQLTNPKATFTIVNEWLRKKA